MNKFLTVLLGAASLTFVSDAWAEGNNGVAAQVGKDTIKVEEIRELYNNADAIKDKVSFEEFYSNVVKNFVGGKLVYQEAIKEKITENPDYVKQIDMLKEELARRMYLEKVAKEQVTEATVNEAYKKYKNEFKSEKEVRAKHILTDDEAKAKEVIEKLKNGENFDVLAPKYTKDKAVDLGYFRKEMMVPEFGNAVFNMKKGAFSETPIKTVFGYHVVLVEDIRDSQPLTKEQATPQIQSALAKDAMAKHVQKLLDNSKDTKVYDLKGNLLK